MKRLLSLLIAAGSFAACEKSAGPSALPVETYSDSLTGLTFEVPPNDTVIKTVSDGNTFYGVQFLGDKWRTTFEIAIEKDHPPRTLAEMAALYAKPQPGWEGAPQVDSTVHPKLGVVYRIRVGYRVMLPQAGQDSLEVRIAHESHHFKRGARHYKIVFDAHPTEVERYRPRFTAFLASLRFES